jgi:hypothetical protein
MASNVSSTFTCFPKLPLELQQLVWGEAALAFSVFSVQRFTANIALPQQTADSQRGPLLYFTPHEDFIHTTSGYRSLFKVCRESRKAAQREIKYLLPIHYLTTDATGSLVPRQVSVPFDPSGHFCISGLARAFEGIKERKEWSTHHPGVDYIVENIHRLQGLEMAITSPINHLMIALDPPRTGWRADYMRGWDDRAFELIASRMPNLKTASLLGEAVMNRRHHLDQFEFDRIHQSVAVVPKNEREGNRTAVCWSTLWKSWKRKQFLYYVITSQKIDAMECRQSQNSNGSALADDSANAAQKRELELNLSAFME